MGKAFVTVAVLSSLLLAGCRSAGDSDYSAGGGGDGFGANGSGGTYGSAGTASVSSQSLAGSAAPGSQQDLAQSVGDRVYFGTDRTDLSPEAQSILQRQAEWMRRYPNVNVTIEGHADERGTREYNLALGDRRASSVRAFLIAQGIPAQRVATVSYGKERPEVTGADEQAWQRNRRAVTAVD
ncbi:peptidoglycan-associated lipoprotein Pal [Oleisolibacter albus]|uniref:peptidoglycan-associated lipoprotein Pal n=1 Tax=Oleisolibacter albus TaxID=2171757 RepID=UPI000DF1BB5D|nr:peptidoglycan-associated lipoprotein Pal [Oleisolibacter albus]